MMINIKTYHEPPFCEKEILRYAGCKGEDKDIAALMHSCIHEVRNKLVYKVCWCEMSVSVCDDFCDFGLFSLTSAGLAKNLENCQKVIVFGATVGVEIDRLIAKYGRISPSRALMFQSIGTERIESLCDAFCGDFNCPTRFSPGYGDLSLDVQKNIFDILDCGKNIGLFLNDSLLMSPTKSVTAFAGVGSKGKNGSKCSNCDKKDCTYRGAK